MAVIYRLISPSNKSYIGLTMDFKSRMKDHSKAKSDFTISNAIRKYGWDNFKKEILEEIDNPKLLPELEKFYIKKYNTYKNGYNETLGGEGTFGYKHTEKTKTLLSENRKGIARSKETKIKISNTLKGTHLSEGTKQKISNSNKGKIFSNKHKQHLSESLKGKSINPIYVKPLYTKWLIRYGKEISDIKMLEYKQKLSNSHKGKIPWNKGIKITHKENI